MKVLIVTVCAFVVAFAAPALRTPQELAAIRALPVLEYDEVHDEFGQYALRYKTAEGIILSQRGRLVPNNEGDGYVLITEGEFSYIGDDGKVYTTKFTAGLDGTKVEGDHLPVAPESVLPKIPEVHEVPNSELVTKVTETAPVESEELQTLVPSMDNTE